jgi:hypothetical protein
MQATGGDDRQVQGNAVATTEWVGEDGERPHMTLFPDGHETLARAPADVGGERPRSGPRLSRRYLG